MSVSASSASSSVVTSPSSAPCDGPDTDEDGTPDCRDGCPADNRLLVHCPRLRFQVDPQFVDADLGGFPVLVRITHAALNTVLPDLSDLYFSDDGGRSSMNFEVESFDRATGALVAWVRVPTVDADDPTVFLLRYGNMGPGSQPASTTTWSSNYAAVFHMNSGGGNASEADSTANAIRAVVDTNNCATPDLRAAPTSVAGGALRFGVNTCTRLVAQDNNALDMDTAVTISAWVYPTTTGTAATESIVSKRVRTNEAANYQVGLSRNPHTMYFMWGGSVGVYPSIRADPPETAVPVTNTWSHLVWMVSGDPLTLRMFINGVRVNQNQRTANGGNNDGASLALNPNGHPLWIGGVDQETDEPFVGHLDEVRIYAGTRNDAWLRAEYESQKPGSTFLSWREEP